MKGWTRIGPPWPSLNEWQRMNPHAKTRFIETWHHDAHWHLYVANIRPPSPLDHWFARVEFLRVGPKELDRDNLWGGAKGMIDALKASPIIWNKKKIMRPDGLPERCWGLYADDNSKWSDIVCTQRVDQDVDRHGSFVKVSWRAMNSVDKA